MPHGERLRTRGEIGLALGFIGLVILAFPIARIGFSGDWHQLVAIVILLLGRCRFPLDPSGRAANTLFARPIRLRRVGNARRLRLRFGLATVLPSMGPCAAWNDESVSAIAFLVLFGSLIGFSALHLAVAECSRTKVATYAYVNPMVAVLLGALCWVKRLHGNEWIGMVIILVAVFLVTSSKMQPDR